MTTNFSHNGASSSGLTIKSDEGDDDARGGQHDQACSDLLGRDDAAVAAALTVARQDYNEHMEGMQELFETMRHRPLLFRAHSINEESSEASQYSPGRHVKTLHLVRHGQGFHNLFADVFQSLGRTWAQFEASPTNPYTQMELLDAPLTEKGRIQAMKLQNRVQQLSNPPQLVVASPQCRALQTAVLAFESLLPPSPPPPEEQRAPPNKSDPAKTAIVAFVAHELVREETGVHLCDQRRSTSRQRREFPHFQFLSGNDHAPEMDEHDALFDAQQRESKKQVGERIYKFLEWLEHRPETHVAIASHSAWLLTLLNGVCDCRDASLREWFQTGELRSIRLEFVRTWSTK